MANQETILLPDIGDFDQVDIIEVAVAVGDSVAVDDTLITLESDKATMDIPAPNAGVVKELLVAVGDAVSEGAPILILESSDEISADSSVNESPETAVSNEAEVARANSQDQATEVKDSSSTNPSSSILSEGTPHPEAKPDEALFFSENSNASAHASPSVRRFARELGVDLGQVTGTGRKGRITKSDVKAFTKQVMSQHKPGAQAQSGFSLPEMPAIDFSKFGPVETVPLTRLKKISGEFLHRSWITVPHVSQFDEADITDLENFRKSKRQQAEQEGTRLTLLSFLIKGVVATLKKYPEFNASLSPDGSQLIMKQYFHIGIAVNTEEGLMVPVVKDADQKGLFDLAKELATLAQKARDKKITPSEMQGGCFTISSLGHIGGTGFTPIVNAPEVAIMGVSKGAMKPVYQDGQFVPRLMLPFSLSYDHRVIDGVAAAEFTRELSQVLSDIRNILI